MERLACQLIHEKTASGRMWSDSSKRKWCQTGVIVWFYMFYDQRGVKDGGPHSTAVTVQAHKDHKKWMVECA